MIRTNTDIGIVMSSNQSLDQISVSVSINNVIALFYVQFSHVMSCNRSNS